MPAHLTLWPEPFLSLPLLISILPFRPIKTPAHRIKRLHPHDVQEKLCPSTLPFTDPSVLRNPWPCTCVQPTPRTSLPVISLLWTVVSPQREGSFLLFPICNIKKKLTICLGRLLRDPSKKSMAASLNQDYVLRVVPPPIAAPRF